MKVCTRCGVERLVSEYYLQKRESGRGHRTYAICKYCISKADKARREAFSEELKAEYAHKMRARSVLRRFGITLDQYEALLASQGGVCALCGRSEYSKTATGKIKHLAVDHDRSCCPATVTCGKCIRGLLCASCNTKLGYFEHHGLLDKVNSYVKGDSK